jgi:hypothetical protein
MLGGPAYRAGVRQGEAARVPQHVRVDWKRHASALPEALNERVKALGRHRAAALRSKHVRARRLFALQAAQGADLVTLNRMNARRSALAAADVQTAGGELNLVPLKIAQLAGPQAVPKGDQDHGCVAVTIAARFAGRGHQGLSRFLSISYFIGSPPIGTSMIAFTSSGGLLPIEIWSRFIDGSQVRVFGISRLS